LQDRYLRRNCNKIISIQFLKENNWTLKLTYYLRYIFKKKNKNEHNFGTLELLY
jgi:hypothetical protein